MQWVESARNFIEKYEMELAGKGVVAIFVSYIIKTGSRFWKKKIQRGVKLMLRSIKPEVYADFGGVVDKPFPNFARWMFGIKKGAKADVSNDDEVKGFADQLIHKWSKE